MDSKSEMAWRTAARLAELAQEADDEAEREYYIRMRDAWITLANRCESFDVPDVTSYAEPNEILNRRPDLKDKSPEAAKRILRREARCPQNRCDLARSREGTRPPCYHPRRPQRLFAGRCDSRGPSLGKPAGRGECAPAVKREAEEDWSR
jgi:hypothetical protein